MADDATKSLTDTQYWDRTWANRAVPRPLDPAQAGLNGTVPRAMHRFFSGLFTSLGLQAGDRILEAGCGGSIVLPYFAQRFGLVAEGLDNSEEGCALSRAIAEQSGIPTAVFLGDVLNPPDPLRERYRVVFSMGLAEHFRPTTTIVNALLALTQAGGYLVTLVPNMKGAPGWLQRVADPSVYEVHVPLSPGELAAAHADCGMEIVRTEYLMSANFSVVNFSGPNSRVPEGLGLRFASWASKAIWMLEKLPMAELRNGVTSPYVVVVARKRG